MLRRQQGIFMGNVKLIKINVMQEHIDTAEVVCSQVNFLTVKSLTDILFAKNFRRFQKQRTRTASRVINLVDLCFPSDSHTSQQFRNLLRSEELAAAFSGIGCVHTHQIFVSITEGINGIVLIIAHPHICHTLDQLHEVHITLCNSSSQFVAVHINIVKQSGEIIFTFTALC